ncbi:MAG: transporter substrate-binding domain-containing protein, partial [Desulfobacteraceae bacterium]|nr:transporter substrate-binding domain-containing protein [Desulfobacteraceae bacterium]
LCLCILMPVSGFCAKLQVVNILNVLTHDKPPLSYEENRQITGFATKIIESVLNKAKIKHFITVYPWDESYAKVLAKENSMIYPLARTFKRELKFIWIGPFADNSIYLFQLHGTKKINIMSNSNIKDYKVGTVSNSPAHQFLTEQKITKDLILADEHTSNIKKLYNKQLDLIAGNEFELIYKIKKLGLNSNNLTKVSCLIQNKGYYLGFNKLTSKSLINKVQTAFDQLQNQGEIEAIKNKFLENE